jgi:hypothetical protein
MRIVCSDGFTIWGNKGMDCETSPRMCVCYALVAGVMEVGIRDLTSQSSG